MIEVMIEREFENHISQWAYIIPHLLYYSGLTTELYSVITENMKTLLFTSTVSV